MRDQELIDQFADLVLGADDPQRLGRQTLEVVLAMTRGRSAAILRPEKTRLSLVASLGVDQSALDAAQAVWRHCRRQLERGEAVYVPERAALKRLAGPPASEVSSLAVVPVRENGGSVAALLYVDSATPRFGDDGAVERLAKFDRIVGKALGVGADIATFAPRASADGAPATAPQRGSREELLVALRGHEWNIARAARVLGVTRRTIYLRLARFNIPREKVRKGEAGLRVRPVPA